MEHRTGTLPDWLTREYPFAQNLHSVAEGVSMNYVDHGEGEPVVMLHGNPTWSYFYRNMVKGLSEAGFRCIAPDHVGCGLSDKPQDYPYRLENHIQNLQSLIEKLDLKEVHLVVHDWGGAIGCGWAVSNRAKLKSLTLLNTAAFRSSRIPMRIAICKLPVIGEFMVRRYNAFAGAAVHMAVQKKLPEDVKRGFLFPYDNYANRIAIARFVQDIPMKPSHPSWQTLTRIEELLPTLEMKNMQAFWGMKDWCFNKRFLRRWEETFPCLYKEPLKKAGHYLLEDAGDEIIPMIQMHLKVARNEQSIP